MCQTMTSIVQIRKHASAENKWKILEVIRTLESKHPRPVDIYNYLYEENLNKVRKDHEDGSILLKHSGTIEAIAKKKIMNIRTIHRKLKDLEKEGLIHHKGQRYFLTEIARDDIRSFKKEYAEEFGIIALSSIMEVHSPTPDLKINLEHLIKLFGLYVIFFLIEACRPLKIPTKGNSKKYDYIPSITRDRLTENWLKKGFDPMIMLQFFLIGLKPIDTDEINISDLWRKKYFWEDIIGLYHEYQNKNSNPNPDPLYELDEEIIQKLSTILLEDYYNYYSKLMAARTQFFSRPKEGSLSDIRDRLVGCEYHGGGKETVYYDTNPRRN